jgi:hypothetical protein
MGWRGTLGTLGAISREAARNSNRRARQRAKEIVFSEKLEAREQAAEAVRDIEEYVETLITLHRSCSPSINWHSQATALAPVQPQLSQRSEAAAQSRLDKYKRSCAAVRPWSTSLSEKFWKDGSIGFFLYRQPNNPTISTGSMSHARRREILTGSMIENVALTISPPFELAT